MEDSDAIRMLRAERDRFAESLRMWRTGKMRAGEIENGQFLDQTQDHIDFLQRTFDELSRVLALYESGKA